MDWYLGGDDGPMQSGFDMLGFTFALLDGLLDLGRGMDQLFC